MNLRSPSHADFLGFGLVLFFSLNPIVFSEVLHDQGAFIWLRYFTAKKNPQGSMMQEKILMINNIYVYDFHIFFSI